MRFRIEHPTRPNTHAIYGTDAALPGVFFAEVVEGKKRRCCDGLHPESGYNPLAAPLEFVLRWFAEPEQGFYSVEDLEEVLILQADGGRIPARLQLPAKVVNDLLNAADED